MMKQVILALSVIILGTSVREAHAWSISALFSNREQVKTSALCAGIFTCGFLGGWHYFFARQAFARQAQEKLKKGLENTEQRNQEEQERIRYLVNRNNWQRKMIKTKVKELQKLLTKNEEISYAEYEQSHAAHGLKQLEEANQEQAKTLEELTEKIYDRTHPTSLRDQTTIDELEATNKKQIAEIKRLGGKLPPVTPQTGLSKIEKMRYVNQQQEQTIANLMRNAL